VIDILKTKITQPPVTRAHFIILGSLMLMAVTCMSLRMKSTVACWDLSNILLFISYHIMKMKTREDLAIMLMKTSISMQ
jgi:hypothetical protein